MHQTQHRINFLLIRLRSCMCVSSTSGKLADLQRSRRDSEHVRGSRGTHAGRCSLHGIPRRLTRSPSCAVLGLLSTLHASNTSLLRQIMRVACECTGYVPQDKISSGNRNDITPCRFKLACVCQCGFSEWLYRHVSRELVIPKSDKRCISLTFRGCLRQMFREDRTFQLHPLTSEEMTVRMKKLHNKLHRIQKQ